MKNARPLPFGTDRIGVVDGPGFGSEDSARAPTFLNDNWIPKYISFIIRFLVKLKTNLKATQAGLYVKMRQPSGAAYLFSHILIQLDFFIYVDANDYNSMYSLD